MCQIVYGGFTRCIPYVEFEVMLRTSLVLDLDHPCVVLHHFCPLRALASLQTALHESAYNRRFPHILVPHKDHFRRFAGAAIEITPTFLPTARW